MKSLALLLLAIILPATVAASTDVDLDTATQRITQADNEPQHWLSYGRDYKEQRHSPLKQINDSNVDELGLSWWFDLKSSRGLEATPLFVDGVLYFTGVWSVVYAVDARTGKALWTYDPKVPRAWGKNLCCGAVNRGVAYYEDKIIFGSLDGRLIALDHKTGERIWETLTIDPKKRYSITGAPRVAKGKVFIGNGGGEFGVRGYITAYDANSGEMVWRFYTVPGNPSDGFENKAMEEAAKTWKGEWWKLGGGGTVWDSIVYDHELDQLIFGVGNGGPYSQDYRSPGGGDNLYISSIVSVNPDTGEYLWHYQQVPGEEWDYTATQQIILTDMQIDGSKKKVLWQAPKNGFFFIIDRTNGKLLSAEPFTAVNWSSGYDLETGRPNIDKNAVDYSDGTKLILPAGVGAHSWHPMSYNPDTGLVYIPVMQVSALFYKQEKETWLNKNGHLNIGAGIVLPPSSTLLSKALLRHSSTGSLLAWDPLTQTASWEMQHPMTWNGGTLSTAGNLVFQGTSDRRLLAVSADKGKLLWEAPTQSSIIAAPISYELDGEQYIAVLAGWGGVFPLMGAAPQEEGKATNGRLLVYKLGGNNKLPAMQAPQVLPELTTRITEDSETLDRGRTLYTDYCSWCHGLDTISSGVLADLRYLTKEKHAIFQNIVLEGAFQSIGMPRFDDELNEQDVQDIQAYIINQSHELKDIQEQPGWWVAFKEWFFSLIARFSSWVTSLM